MTMYTTRSHGLQTAELLLRVALLSTLGLALAGCDVEWGGASVQLEDPSPPPEEAVPPAAGLQPVEAPLPVGPLLYLAATVGARGETLVLPIARLVDGVPAPLEFPEPVPEGYRQRFDATFVVPGRELALAVDGVRAGSLVLSGSPRLIDAGCPSAIPAQVLLPPGSIAPSIAFATRPEELAGAVERPTLPLVDERIRTFGPILAEQILREGGEDRPFLAQRAELIAVPWPGDPRPAMAATYLINDALGQPAPTRNAASLFFLARFDPTRGYVADWYEMRTYGTGASREAYTWVQAIPGAEGRIDFAARHDGSVRRLVASAVREEGERHIDWTEGTRCPALELLESLRAANDPADGR